MYCRHCGEKLEEDAHFCAHCEKLVEGLGTAEHEKTEPEPVVNLEKSVVEAPLETNTDERLYAFVGNFERYYKSKWTSTDHPESKAYWNWAAFFLAPYWLGYRKMYFWLFIYTGTFIGLLLIDWVSTLTLNTGLELTTIDNVIRVGIGVFFGIYGNALYYRYARKRVAVISAETPADQLDFQLRQKGGTSTGGVWAAVGLMVLISFISLAIWSTTPYTVNNISFGKGWNNDSITGVTDTFKPGQAIYLSTSWNTPIETTHYTIYILKTQGNSEEIYKTRTEEIDPTWEGMDSNLYNPTIDHYTIPPGHYIVRIVAKSNVLSEGTFNVQTMPKGTTY